MCIGKLFNMARRRKHSLQEIKAMSLQAAESIVIKEGYQAVTARRIAMEIGYTVGSLYLVFDNMSDLLLHLKARILENLYQQLRYITEVDQTAEKTIIHLANSYLTFAQHNLYCWQLLSEYSTHHPFWYLRKQQLIFHLFKQPLTQMLPSQNTQQYQLMTRILCGSIQGICCLTLSSSINSVTNRKIEQMINMQINCFLSGYLQNHVT